MDRSELLLAFLAGAGAALAASCAAARYFRADGPTVAKGRSVTSSAGGGPAAYETTRAVDEYLQFHYGDKDVLPYERGPKDALNFVQRCALLCEKYCVGLQDFTGENGEVTALDVGCAVGGTTFELARSFPHVLGLDYSQKFVSAAKEMLLEGSMAYQTVVEGELMERRVACVPDDIERSRVRFMVGDACALPDLRPFDAILASNLICRLPDPMSFFRSLPRLTKQGGIVVLISPYSWLEAWTPKSQWLGGYWSKDEGAVAVRTAKRLQEVMDGLGFDLVHQEDVPFMIREHARKYQWGMSHGTVWKKRTGE
ncbi:unnamed protein product [Ostreobium quekettii]|uniref:Methyltransferase type 11 domain-containing protein n=1 Tax=Ostreobium quekettii TaxID=121088 RepID=A0A8S1JHP1_9CHLO|nr:unnamed protein product [Ostreobium quekettii]|eukprot:evm.model.scf_1021.4 EVM.evm.TU.scf_1021.4   scf_1021:47931-52243(-)